MSHQTFEHNGYTIRVGYSILQDFMTAHTNFKDETGDVYRVTSIATTEREALVMMQSYLDCTTGIEPARHTIVGEDRVVWLGR